LPHQIKRVAFMVEADTRNSPSGRRREALSFSELDVLIQAIDQVLQQAAKMKAEETEEMHIRVDVKKGLWIGFRQRNHEQEAYLNLNALGSDALLQFDIADLPKLKAIATGGAEKLQVMHTKEADYPAMEAALSGRKSRHRF